MISKAPERYIIYDICVVVGKGGGEGKGRVRICGGKDKNMGEFVGE